MLVLCPNCSESLVGKKERKKKKSFSGEKTHFINLSNVVHREEDTLNSYLYFHHKKQLDLRKRLRESTKEQQPEAEGIYTEKPIQPYNALK